MADYQKKKRRTREERQSIVELRALPHSKPASQEYRGN